MIGWIVLGTLVYFFFGQIAYFIEDYNVVPKEKAIAVSMFWPIYFVAYLLRIFVRSANILVDDILGGNL